MAFFSLLALRFTFLRLTGFFPALLLNTSEWGISKSRPLVPQTSALPLRHTLERMTGIEPALLAWKASALPLSYIRMTLEEGRQASNRTETACLPS